MQFAWTSFLKFLPLISNFYQDLEMMRIMKRNSPKYIYIFIGVLASSAMGAVMPLFGIIFGNILGVLSYEDTQKARDESVGYAGWFVGLGLFAFLTQFIQVGQNDLF